MFRIILISIISLTAVLFPFFIIGSLKEGQNTGFAIYVFILVMGGAFFPTLLADFIFYLLVKKMDKKKTRFWQKVRVCLFFNLICAAGLFMWAAGEWFLSGDQTWNDFLKRYEQFAAWNFVLIPTTILMTFLYFSRFISSAKPD